MSDKTYSFDATLCVMSGSNSEDESADKILEHCLDADIACSLAGEGTLNVRAAADALEQAQSTAADRLSDNLLLKEEVYRRDFDLEGANERIEQLEAALKHYANQDRWRKVVIDSYSGECDFFDWDGDLADEPWGIASGALIAGDTPPESVISTRDTCLHDVSIFEKCVSCHDLSVDRGAKQGNSDRFIHLPQTVPESK